jgi:hypothetical protein
MKCPIAIFFHARLSGNGVEFNHATGIFQEIVHDIGASGLGEAASEFTIGVNGGDADYVAACMMSPEKANLVQNPIDSIGELPTLHLVEEWVKTHPNWYVCYVHTKGALHSGDTKVTWAMWRHCLSNVVIWGWLNCVKALDEGFDCAGPHYITPERYPSLCSSSYFGGNWWWATSKHLARLKPIDLKGWTRYAGEAWIGYVKDGRKMRVMPFANHFPMAGCGA